MNIIEREQEPPGTKREKLIQILLLVSQAKRIIEKLKI